MTHYTSVTVLEYQIVLLGVEPTSATCQQQHLPEEYIRMYITHLIKEGVEITDAIVSLGVEPTSATCQQQHLLFLIRAILISLGSCLLKSPNSMIRTFHVKCYFGQRHFTLKQNYGEYFRYTHICEPKWIFRDSNPRPSGYEPETLTN